MKSLLSALVVLACSFSIGYSQAKITKPKLSAFTQQYLLACKKQNGGSTRIPNYVYKNINNKTYLSALIRVDNNVDEAALDALGIFVGTKAGSIWTVQIPIEKLPAFTNTSGVNYISLDAPIFPMLDSARKETRADSAQRGINLPMAMTGKNVVVGVIDAGFDFNHPTMHDTTNTQLRIKRVWTQKITGTPPTGFAYGNEMSDSNIIKARGYDTAILSHGTHVTGIAAGSGYGSVSNSRFRGMSYESDIVLVGIMPAPGEWAVAGESDIIDGLNYIYTYAASIGEPAVINLSWGSTLGPHDGNSLFSTACDALTGTGKIFVCAAGNNGEDTVHLQKSFTAADTTVSTFVTFSPYLDSNHQYTWVDAWGDTGKTFCMNVKLYSGATAIDSTGFVCLTDTTLDFNLIGSNGDTCFVTITTFLSDYNGKPHALIEFYSKVHDNICLTTKATDGLVNMWEGYVFPPEGYYGYFRSLAYPWAVSGDVNMTVSDIGCTRSAITVGAYNSKVSFHNINGTLLGYQGFVHGAIAPFSSFGPTEDHRVKPDITAPGLGLASAINSYDTSYNATGTNYSAVMKADTDFVNNRIYRYAVLQGTSMASPCVAGIVAMMLQLYPSLTPDSAKAIIKATAITDTYTGVLPAAGTNTWGHGKINAYNAMGYMTNYVSVESVNINPADCILYPNPNRGGFSISYLSKAQEQLNVEIYDLSGKLVYTRSWFVNTGMNNKQFNTTGLSKGIYFTKVSSKSGYNVIKTEIE